MILETENNYTRICVTGGYGFIGSALVRMLLKNNIEVLNIDKLTYAGNVKSLTVNESGNLIDYSLKSNYHFIKKDIVTDLVDIKEAINDFKPEVIIHLAAESHVDNSIKDPSAFIKTNIIGTFNMLEISRGYYENLDSVEEKTKFRFLYVSTDEVYGSLGDDGLFSEKTNYDPSSPYSASKASGDHLVQAWNRTYGLPTLRTNCSNNYGEYQHIEKLIPHMISKAYHWENLPVYGNGKNIRDWLYVDDHCDAIMTVLNKGVIGESYNIGGFNERTNNEVVEYICKIMDDEYPQTQYGTYFNKITYVEDRKGHDKRYAIDSTKIRNKLGWRPKETFESGLKKTVQWYMENRWWWK